MHKLICGATVGLMILSVATTRADEPVAAPPEEKGWESAAAAGLTLTSGNSDTVLITGTIGTSREWERDIWALGASVTYGKNDGEKNNEKATGFVDWQHLFNERFYASLRLSAEHDAIADLEYRVTVGPSLGYYFIKSERTRLNAEIGPAYVVEKKDVVTDQVTGEINSEMDTFLTLRAAEKFEHQLTPNSKIWQMLEILPQVDDWENFIASIEVGAEAAMNESLSLRLVLQDKYDNQPAEGKKRNDLTLIGAVAYKF